MPGLLCPCGWFSAHGFVGSRRIDQAGNDIVRCNMSTMSWAECLKADPQVVAKLIGAETKEAVDQVEKDEATEEAAAAAEEEEEERWRWGRVLSYTAATGIWVVQWRKLGSRTSDDDDAGVSADTVDAELGRRANLDWSQLQAVLSKPELEAGDESEAIAFASVMRKAIKPEWVAECPQAEMNIDGREKRFCTVVGYTESGGTNNESFKVSEPAHGTAKTTPAELSC